MKDGSTPLADVRGASVYVGDVRVGAVSDVFADGARERVVGFEVAGADERRWFLPWVVCTLEAGAVRSPSPLVFVAEDHLAFYARHGARLLESDTQDASVEPDGRVVRSTEVSGHGVLALVPEGTSAP